jgi:hypothetical protein
MDGYCHIFANRCCKILSFRLLAYNVIWAFPAAFQHPSRIAQRLSNSSWAFPSGFLIPFSSAQQVSNSLSAHFPSAIGKKQASSGYFPLSNLSTFINRTNRSK